MKGWITLTCTNNSDELELNVTDQQRRRFDVVYECLECNLEEERRLAFHFFFQKLNNDVRLYLA